MSESWIDTGPVDRILSEDVAPFEHEGKQYALYRTADDRYFATDGLCTHESVELAKRSSRGAASFVNAVLRRATREGRALLAGLDDAMRELVR